MQKTAFGGALLRGLGQVAGTAVGRTANLTGSKMLNRGLSAMNPLYLPLAGARKGLGYLGGAAARNPGKALALGGIGGGLNYMTGNPIGEGIYGAGKSLANRPGGVGQGLMDYGKGYYQTADYLAGGAVRGAGNAALGVGSFANQVGSDVNRLGLPGGLARSFGTRPLEQAHEAINPAFKRTPFQREGDTPHLRGMLPQGVQNFLNQRGGLVQPRDPLDWSKASSDKRPQGKLIGVLSKIAKAKARKGK